MNELYEKLMLNFLKIVEKEGYSIKVSDEENKGNKTGKTIKLENILELFPYSLDDETKENIKNAVRKDENTEINIPDVLLEEVRNIRECIPNSFEKDDLSELEKKSRKMMGLIS